MKRLSWFDADGTLQICAPIEQLREMIATLKRTTLTLEEMKPEEKDTSFFFQMRMPKDSRVYSIVEIERSIP